MKQIVLLPLLCLFTLCTVGSDIKDGMNYNFSGTSTGPKVSMRFTRGKNYQHIKSFGIVKVKIRPQLAVWLEDTSGKYLQTVFVTKSFGKQKWKGAKPGKNTCLRPMCMPYWLNRFKAAGNSAPTPAAPLPDGVTGATARGSFAIDIMLPESLSTVVLFAEWNSSFDNNEYFTKEKASFNGQPSVIASVRMGISDSEAKERTLTITGYGGSKGDDPELYPDLAKLTTAKTIFSSVTAAITP